MVARDYKRSKAHRDSFSGWTGLLIGAVGGLAVGLALYFLDPRTPAAPAGDAAAEPEPASARESTGQEPAERYDFYEMLPNFEVVVPEREAAVRRDAPAAPVERAGAYVLQVGSYRKFTEADRIRAQLALQGIESKVQRVSVDNDTWHRVRIGPITDLRELNRIRDRLREADMDLLVIRVGD
ncbi:MAG TPA: SPOR domain-containing protein [Steroidobacteraceae bacterium]|nr:SPOR domain-containing protein [Steroidobacteraceae bacterium]